MVVYACIRVQLKIRRGLMQGKMMMVEYNLYNMQVGLHQFKVSNGDYIYVEKLKYCDCLGKDKDSVFKNRVMFYEKENKRHGLWFSIDPLTEIC